MVTIYTERGPAAEVMVESEKRSFSFGRLAAISMGTALLLSLVAAFNLKSDVDNLTLNLQGAQNQLQDIQPRFDAWILRGNSHS